MIALVILLKFLGLLIPAAGGIVMLLLWLRVIPFKKDLDENEKVYRKYSNFILTLSIIMFLTVIMRFFWAW
ncbi:MAG: hypothetical protein A2017_04925 [Lentisphaerae bacterium GWF2_44_16]|nr:MAG: hypothetical protein A2017_04925 [Lentisphaerae bacterium GWF2_44_16]